MRADTHHQITKLTQAMEKFDVVTTASLGLLGPFWSLANCTGSKLQQISGEELELIDAHATVGILLSGWVVFRLGWGFIGPKYARFSTFPLTSPKQVMHSMRRCFTKQT